MASPVRESEIARKQENTSVLKGFTAKTFSKNDENLTFEKGDTFTLPKEFTEVYHQQIGTYFAEYIIVDCNGVGKRLYSSAFYKNVRLYDKDVLATGQSVAASGTAVEEFQKHDDVQSGMQALAGKTLRISNIQRVTTKRFGQMELMSTPVMTIDIVEGEVEETQPSVNIIGVFYKLST